LKAADKTLARLGLMLGKQWGKGHAGYHAGVVRAFHLPVGPFLIKTGSYEIQHCLAINGVCLFPFD
jgi:hypothetical protein